MRLTFGAEAVFPMEISLKNDWIKRYEVEANDELRRELLYCSLKIENKLALRQ